MARRFRRKSNRTLYSFLSLIAVGGAGYGVYRYGLGTEPDSVAPIITPETVLSTSRPEPPIPISPENKGVAEKGRDPESEKKADGKERADKLIASGRAAAAANDWITARAQLNEALELELSNGDATGLRADLSKLANDTIFSSQAQSGDPLVSHYLIAAGDTLAKVAAKYKITPQLLARINDIADPNVIRSGRRLKVLHGPFHVVVTKADYRMDVYLQDVFVRHYRVGLGSEDSTPTGQWKVTEKLVNPVYYPPRGGKIIASDDPVNPLGERWLGLEGVSGDAVGMERYGIHGTIEPQSIGTSTTLGCVRLYNEDVEFVFDLLIPGESKVLIR